jgi:branched-chain amino acid transport system permease protein
MSGIWLGLAALALLTLALTATQSAFTAYILDSVLLASMGAIALNVLMGTAGQVSLGNAAFLLIGGLAAVFFLRAGVGFPLDVACAVIVSGIMGLLVGLPALRLAGLFLALATLAAHFIVLHFGMLYQASVPGAAAAGFTVQPLFEGVDLSTSLRYWSWILFGIVAVLILGARRVMRDRSGRALRMIRDHEFVAPMLGIPVARYKLSIFVLASMVVGLEGGLAAHFSGSVSTDNYTLLVAIQYLAMILIGGLDSIAGAVIGAAIVVALPALVPNLVGAVLGRSSLASQGPQIAQIIYGVLIVIFIVSSPDGIMGWLRNVSWFARPSEQAVRTLG